jgi:hypothetical protein
MRIILYCAILTLGFLSTPVTAGYRPPVESQGFPGGALLRVNRQTVLTLRGPAADPVLIERAARIEQRLSAAIEAGLLPGAIAVRRPDGQAAVFAGDAEVARPTAADAHAAGTTTRRLASRWAAALRHALSLPPLTVSAPSLLVPFGESRSLRVGGVATGALTLTPRDESVVKGEVGGDGRSVRVSAGQPGETVLSIERDGAMLGVRVVVKKYAGEPVEPATVECTGRPAPAELVRQLAMDSYRRSLRIEPGARVAMAGKPQLPGALGPGEDGWGSVPVAITGPGLLPCSAVAQVRVHCRNLPHREADALLYSNDPERLQRPGRLYLGEVERNAPCRLLYHHQNMAGAPLILRVDLANPEDTPVDVQVVAGDSPPMVDTVLVGLRAGATYLRRSARDIGRIYTLAGHQRLTLIQQRLAHRYTASGIYGLRMVSGQRLLVDIHADAPSAPFQISAVKFRAGRSSATESPIQDPTAEARNPEAIPVQHVYPNPRRVLHAEYSVGGNWAFVRLGKHGIPGKPRSPGDASAQVLDGDYGVLYDISVQIENPTRERRVVRLMLAPDAGGARGVFLVDEKWIEAPHLIPPSEFQLAQFVLSPRERRVVNIRTLPVGGSAYPVTLVVR